MYKSVCGGGGEGRREIRGGEGGRVGRREWEEEAHPPASCLVLVNFTLGAWHTR